MASTNFEALARNIICWYDYYSITCSVYKESTINRGHEFGEKLGHESNIELRCVLFGYIVI